MARNDPDDYDALLAEVESTLSGTPATRPDRPATRPDDAARTGRKERGATPVTAGDGSSRTGLAGAVGGAVVPAGVLGVLIALLWFVVPEPFPGFVDAGLGAFLAAFLVVAYGRWRRG